MTLRWVFFWVGMTVLLAPLAASYWACHLAFKEI